MKKLRAKFSLATFRSYELLVGPSLRAHRQAVPHGLQLSEFSIVGANLKVGIVDIRKSSPLAVNFQESLRLIEEDPVVEVVYGAIYVPRERLSKHAWPVLYDAQGSVVESTLLHKDPHGGHAPFDPVSQDMLRAARRSSDPRPHIYVGDMPKTHFGHFLTEGISRLWYALLTPSDAVLLYHGPPVESWPAYARDLVRGLGIEQRLVRFDSVTSVDRLVVPGPSMINGYCIHRAHAIPGDLYCTSQWTQPEPTDMQSSGTASPLYLSRRRLLGGNRLVAGEGVLERDLESIGVTIIHSQELSLRDQIDFLRNHDPIIGAIGSAFHAALLTGVSRTMIYLAGEHSTPNQVLVDALMGNRSCYARTLSETFHGSMTPDRSTLPVLKAIIRGDLEFP